MDFRWPLLIAARLESENDGHQIHNGRDGRSPGQKANSRTPLVQRQRLELVYCCQRPTPSTTGKVFMGGKNCSGVSIVIVSLPFFCLIRVRKKSSLGPDSYHSSFFVIICFIRPEKEEKNVIVSLLPCPYSFQK